MQTRRTASPASAFALYVGGADLRKAVVRGSAFAWAPGAGNLLKREERVRSLRAGSVPARPRPRRPSVSSDVRPVTDVHATAPSPRTIRADSDATELSPSANA